MNDLLAKIDLKSALIGAVAVIVIMLIAALPYLFVKGVIEADKRYEQGQKTMIEQHKVGLKYER